MVGIRRVGSDDWQTVREVRLSALTDAPDWFWATHEEEVDKPETWWKDFIDLGAWFVAFESERPVGIAAAIRASELEDSDRQLISMWVAPAFRRLGIGRRLIDAVKEAARKEGVTELQLQVTETNTAAARLYERCGFQATGATTPLPRDPGLIEHEMRLRL
jgi:ribosomal protein S18 acetylase RimI-like enzyme